MRWEKNNFAEEEFLISLFLWFKVSLKSIKQGIEDLEILFYELQTEIKTACKLENSVYLAQTFM